MACFLVPGTEAIVTTAIVKVVSHIEKKRNNLPQAAAPRLPFSVKLGWLSKLLWGGSALLAFEHLWHGEVTLSFPFLTAVSEGPEATSAMLSEMATSGVAMALLVTLVWAGMVAVSAVAENRAAARPAKKEEAQP